MPPGAKLPAQGVQNISDLLADNDDASAAGSPGRADKKSGLVARKPTSKKRKPDEYTPLNTRQARHKKQDHQSEEESRRQASESPDRREFGPDQGFWGMCPLLINRRTVGDYGYCEKCLAYLVKITDNFVRRNWCSFFWGAAVLLKAAFASIRHCGITHSSSVSEMNYGSGGLKRLIYCPPLKMAGRTACHRGCIPR